MVDDSEENAGASHKVPCSDPPLCVQGLDQLTRTLPANLALHQGNCWHLAVICTATCEHSHQDASQTSSLACGANVLSGLLLGAYHAPEYVHAILQNRAVLPLSLRDVERLVSCAWPAIRRRGLWQEWMAHLQGLFQEATGERNWALQARFGLQYAVSLRWRGQFQHAGEVLDKLLHGKQYLSHDIYGAILIERSVIWRYQARDESARAVLNFVKVLPPFEYMGISSQDVHIQEALLCLEEGTPRCALDAMEAYSDNPRVLAIRAESWRMLGDLTRATESAQEAVQLSAHDQPNQCRARSILGHCFLAAGDLDSAANQFENALAVAKLVDPVGAARITALQGHLAILRGDFRAAQELLEFAADQQLSMGDWSGARATLKGLLDVLASLTQEALNAQNAHQAALLAQSMQARLRRLNRIIGC